MAVRVDNLEPGIYVVNIQDENPPAKADHQVVTAPNE